SFESYRHENGLGTHVSYRTVNKSVTKQWVIEQSKLAINEFKTKKEINKLSNIMQKVYELGSIAGTFATSNVFRDTRVLVGKKGLKKLATPENVRGILDKLEVHVQIR